MLDQHRLDPDRGISDLFYDVDYEEPVVMKSWEVIVGRYKKYWNVFALDMKNEPRTYVYIYIYVCVCVCMYICRDT